MDELWYYEYTVEVYESGRGHVILKGLIPAFSMMNAVEHLIEYYGEENLYNILTLKAIFEGPVLDFEMFNRDKTFDLSIIQSTL